MAPLIFTRPFGFVPPPTGELSSKIARQSATVRLHKAGTEKVLLSARIGFPEYTVLYFLDTATDALSAAVDVDTGGGDNNTSLGSFHNITNHAPHDFRDLGFIKPYFSGKLVSWQQGDRKHIKNGFRHRENGTIKNVKP